MKKILFTSAFALIGTFAMANTTVINTDLHNVELQEFDVEILGPEDEMSWFEYESSCGEIGIYYHFKDERVTAADIQAFDDYMCK
ncbi:hypothetical protein OBK20_02185 [Empedobacter falsenii]|uniref:Uncharacterized protein n=1 Tax=Empedobacter stercoris TaxID=1628248 RepID=A0ABX1WNF1_9FLAO|nr:hypothetical protein [Empedobacter stercoris]NOJ76218.1 hypothetical protein [Empedobacter stercoris]